MATHPVYRVTQTVPTYQAHAETHTSFAEACRWAQGYADAAALDYGSPYLKFQNDFRFEDESATFDVVHLSLNAPIQIKARFEVKHA